MIFEIELKALLSKEKYDELITTMPSKMKLINKETMHTTRFRPGDVRLRYSNQRFEIIAKLGNASEISRKEVAVDLKSKEELDKMVTVLEMLNFKADPPWIKKKHEYEYEYKGYTYIICLQDIENFAYILEVEFLSETDDRETHEPNLRTIISELGCEAINPEEFKGKIEEYIENNN